MPLSPELLDEIEQTQHEVCGFVYLIRCAGSTFYKIGKAKNVKDRRDMLQIGCPYYLHIYATIRSGNPERLEKRMHKKFNAKRMYGEWFNLTQEEITKFCEEPNCTVTP